LFAKGQSFLGSCRSTSTARDHHVCRTDEEDRYTPPLLLVLLSTEPSS
jgi:hypothetical protein